MPSYLLLRLFCFVSAILLPALFLGAQTFNALILIPLTLTHYILAIVYSKRQLGMLGSSNSPVPSIKFGCLIAASVALFVSKPLGGLHFVFGFHHVFSEVYLLHENVLSNFRREETKNIRIASIAFNLAAYFIATGVGVLAYPLELQFLLWSGLAVSGVANLFFLRQLSSQLTRRQVIETLTFELVPLGLIAVSLLTSPIPIAMIVYYHVLFWFFYPCLKMVSFKRMKPIGIYLASNAVLFSIFLMLVVGVSPDLKLDAAQKSFLFIFGSYFHILTTLSLSTAQPAFLTKFFNPKLFTSSQRPVVPMANKSAALVR